MENIFKIFYLILILIFILLTIDIIKNSLYYSPLLVVYIFLFFNLFSFYINNNQNIKND